MEASRDDVSAMRPLAADSATQSASMAITPAFYVHIIRKAQELLTQATDLITQEVNSDTSVVLHLLTGYIFELSRPSLNVRGADVSLGVDVLHKLRIAQYRLQEKIQLHATSQIALPDLHDLDHYKRMISAHGRISALQQDLLVIDEELADLQRQIQTVQEKRAVKKKAMNDNLKCFKKGFHFSYANFFDPNLHYETGTPLRTSTSPLSNPLPNSTAGSAGLPNDLSVYWQQYPWIFGEKVCKIRALVSEMTSYTSVLTIVAFSTERYLAICHPLHSYAMSGLKRALRIIAALWVIGLVSAMPFAVFTNVHYVDYPPGSGFLINESAFCALFDDDLPANCPLYELSFILFFLVPMLIIIVLYGCIGVRIRKRSRHSLGKRVEGAVHGESRHMKTRKSIIRMLAAVVVTFFLCWAPFHAQRLLYLYADRNAPYYLVINEWLYYIAGCFYYFSSTVNPVLYNIMSIKYRNAFRQTLCCFKYKRNRSRDPHSSFHDTIIQSNENTHWRRSLTWRQTSKRSLKSNGTDVVVMIAPINDNEQSRRASSNWRKTFLRVTMGSRLTKNATGRCADIHDECEISSPRNKVSIQLETCI